MPSQRKRTAFTLIELLVVVAIIALLVSILVPSLSAAREQARAVNCMANMQSIGRELYYYAEKHQSYLPGPTTSGAHIVGAGFNGNSWWFKRGPATTPLFNVDWISPMMGEYLEIDPAWRYYERFEKIANHLLTCPSNRETYRPGIFGGTIPYVKSEEVLINAYSAIQPFMHTSAKSQAGYGQPGYIDSRFQSGIPDWYTPRYDNVGNPADNVFVVEGCRYIVGSEPGATVSLNNLPWQVQGGNFCLFGPNDRRSGNPWTLIGENSTQLAALYRVAYRHNKKMNMVFFDGHVERVTVERSLKNERWYTPGRGAEIP